MDQQIERPQITNYQDPVEFIRDMVAHRRRSEPDFSVSQETKSLRRVSPALVTLILQRKRKITIDRLDEFAKLMALSASERIYFRDWVRGEEGFQTADKPEAKTTSSRKEVTTHILSDWLNVYVKDCFQIPEVQKNPALVYSLLGAVASRKRIDRSIAFLLREGHLRRTMNGHLEVEVNLVIAAPKLPSAKIRQFHKAALQIAKSAIDRVPPDERMANSLLIPLDEDSKSELLELISEFGSKLQDFAARPKRPGDRLYQFILNLSPTGGKTK